MLLSDPASSSLDSEVIAFVRELGMELETGPRHPGPTPNGCALKTSSTGQGCMRHRYSCVVSMYGRVYPCVGVLLPLGNVHDESLRDILRQSEVIENLLNHRKLMKEPCRDCLEAEVCYGCRGAAFIATGDYLAPDPTCPRLQGLPIESLPVAVASLIPHGATIRMIDRLMQVGERQAMAEYFVPDTCPFVDADGRLDETAYIELIAQTLAACHGFHLPREEQPLHRGLLLGVKDLQIVGEARVGDYLRINVRKTTRYGGFGVAEGVVSDRGGLEVAHGELKVLQTSTDSAGVFE
jgi:radical SAM protein with 4Fe4S-binding SPASM domain